jgi:hypothetical protein
MPSVAPRRFSTLSEHALSPTGLAAFARIAGRLRVEGGVRTEIQTG